MKKSFFSLVTSEQAYQAIGAFAALPVEDVDWRAALGRVLAADVTAVQDVPHFERSNMDGFAVVAADTFAASDSASVRLRVSGQVAMGTCAERPIAAGTAVRVSTGAMLPPGADAVVIVEKTEEPEPDTVFVREPVVPGQNVIRVGEDMHAGDVVLRAGRRIKPGDMGVLAAAGAERASVVRRPRAGVIVTGDEIIDPGTPLALGQVRNVNEFVLTAMAERYGAVVQSYGVVGDDESTMAATLTRAVAENDVVFISGGSSKGSKDYTLGTVQGIDDARVLFHGVAIAPGKPTLLARTSRTAVMGLPGNPAAVVVVFALFGSTLLRVLGGERIEEILATRPTTSAVLAATLRSTPGREDYVRVRLEPHEGLARAIPLPGKSVAISTVGHADGLVRIPLSRDGMAEGETVEVMLL